MVLHGDKRMSKRDIILLFSILFLFVGLLFADLARAVCFISGTSAAAGGGCTTDDDSQLVVVGAGHGAWGQVNYMGSPFTLGAEADITEYIVQVCDNNSDVGNVVVSIWTDGGSEPGSEISGTKVETAASELENCTTGANSTHTLASTYEALSAGDYYFVIYENESADINKRYDTFDAGEKLLHGSDGENWSSINNNCIYFEIYGCQAGEAKNK